MVCSVCVEFKEHCYILVYFHYRALMETVSSAGSFAAPHMMKVMDLICCEKYLQVHEYTSMWWA